LPPRHNAPGLLRCDKHCATLIHMQVRSAFYFWFWISVPGG
jgi:hypothetical protein